MKLLLYSLCFFPFIAFSQQCDLEILSYDFFSGDLSIYAHNTLECGCNEYTMPVNGCSSSTAQQNNESVSHLVFGLHAIGLDTNWLPCLSATYHAGWSFKQYNSDLYSGDTLDINLYDVWTLSNDCWQSLISSADTCLELVIWQINFSQTLTTTDDPVWGWSNGTSAGSSTSFYPDMQPWNNSIQDCPEPCIEVVETIYQFITDTIFQTEYLIYFETIYDTISVETFITDTIYITEIQQDTIFLPPPPPDTIYFKPDSIWTTEYIISTEYLDCETGLPCDSILCQGASSIYVPNTMTPNGDGINDFWEVISDPECWHDYEVKVYNRWGLVVWESDELGDVWYGDDVSDGVYTYIIKVNQFLLSEYFHEIVGHVHVFR